MKTTLYLSIAGFIFKLVFHKSTDKQNKVTPQHFVKDILQYNEGFLLHTEPPSTDFIIEFLEAKGFDIYEDPKAKRFIHFYSPVAYHHISTFYHISRVQFIYLLKSAIEQLLFKKGFVLHCSANLVKGKAVIYVGKSGIGKTTVVSLLKKKYEVLADDEGYIKKEGKEFYFYQGPFLERSYSFSKRSKRYKIAAVFMLEHGKHTVITQLNKEEIVRSSLQLISSSDESQSLSDRTLLASLRKNIPIQTLVFTKNKEELMNCILNHSPFDDTTGFDAE